MHFAMTPGTEAFVHLAARVALVVLFPFSAVDKIAHWQEALKQARSSILPGAPLLLAAAIAIESVAPVLIVARWHDAPAALLLAAFCIITALLYHPFWQFPNFWSADAEGRAHFWDFLKNFGLAGGLALLALTIYGG